MTRQGFRRTSIDDAFGLVGPGRLAQKFVGTGGDDTLIGTSEADSFDLSQGGSDRVMAGPGQDNILFGTTFDSSDEIDGGDGFDYLHADIDSTYLVISDAMMTGIEVMYVRFLQNSSMLISAQLDASLSVYITNYDNRITSQTVDCQGHTADVDISAGQRTNVNFLGGSGDDSLALKYYVSGDQDFDGGAGSDTIGFSYWRKGVAIDLRDVGPQSVRGGHVTLSDVENVVGTSRGDTLVGTDGVNAISLGGGKDQILAGGGDDYIVIGASSSAPTTRGLVDGEEGSDLITFYYSIWTKDLHVSLGTNKIQDTGEGHYRLESIEDVSGSFFNDTFSGNGVGNRLLGDMGNDILLGGSGDDILSGDGFVEFDHGVTVFNFATDHFGGYTDRLEGGSGDDTLYGGGSSDILNGGSGTDMLYGGEGNGRFLFSATRDSRVKAPDTIADFAAGDVIDVSAIDAKTTIEGDQRFHFGATGGHAGDILIAFDATRGVTVVDLYVDGDAKADMTIDLTGNIPLNASSFVL